jgi:hypothetical protein
MLDVLENLLEKAVSLKNIKNEACRNGLLIVVTNEIINHYRFLIPNERNKREASIYQEWMENAPVINAAQQSNDEFALFFVLKEEIDKENPCSKGLLEFLVANSIILKKGKEVEGFKKYYGPFTKSGRCFFRSSLGFKRPEQRTPYENEFLTYLRRLMYKENIKIHRINYEYGFSMEMDVTFPIEEYAQELKISISNPLTARKLSTEITSKAVGEFSGLYFEDLCRGGNVKCFIPYSSLEDYGLSNLDAFEELETYLKRDPNRSSCGHRYNITEKLSLIVNNNPNEHYKMYCRVTFQRLQPMEFINRLYSKEAI